MLSAEGSSHLRRVNSHVQSLVSTPNRPSTNSNIQRLQIKSPKSVQFQSKTVSLFFQSANVLKQECLDY